MKTDCPCSAPASPRQRVTGFLRWFLPGAVLALMPKCPVCLAAYVALISGIGISLPVATFLRTTLIILCVLSLVFLSIRYLRRHLSTNPTH